LRKIILIDDQVIQDHLGRIVRDTREKALNAMLDAEATFSSAPATQQRLQRSEQDHASRYPLCQWHSRSTTWFWLPLDPRAEHVNLLIQNHRTVNLCSKVLHHYPLTK